MHLKRVLTFAFVFVLMLLLLSGCWSSKGSVVILEKPGNTQFDVSFDTWSDSSKCEMSLNKGDEVRVEVALEGGELDLSMRGNKGSEPYTGNDIKEIAFTVKADETDVYVFRFSGTKASGIMTLMKVTK